MLKRSEQPLQSVGITGGYQRVGLIEPSFV